MVAAGNQSRTSDSPFSFYSAESSRHWNKASYSKEIYILNFRSQDRRIGEDECRQYSATATVTRLEKTFNMKGFFTAPLFAALTQRSEGTTFSKQETCAGEAFAAAPEATAEALRTLVHLL